MTFEQFCRILIKRWSLVVICFLFVGLGAYIGSSKFIKPVYQSSVLIEVAINSGGTSLNNDNILASQQLAGTEAQLATTAPVLSMVASHYHGLTVDDLAKEVTASAKSTTQLFEIDVQDPNPTQAAKIANDVAATLIKQQIQVTQSGSSAPAAQPNPVPGAAPTTEPTTPQGSFLVIAQPARPASSPAKPNNLINTTGGLLAGLMLGILLALMFEQLDTRVPTPEALTQLLDWPVLARLWKTGPEEDVVNLVGYNSNIDSYGILRTNVGFATLDKPLYTLVVTSGTPGEGKSVVAANLAICMARAGKNTLLIDANLRRPTLHEQFNIPAHAMGFSNAVLAFNMPTITNAHSAPTTDIKSSSSAVVTGQVSLGPFVRAVGVPNLYVMPSGPLPPNPAELLDSKAMQRLFAALSNCGAEVVIFDAPPLLGLPDATVLASRVDGTLVVVDTTRANKRNLKQVKALLEQAKVCVLGCVVNKQRRSRKDTHSSYGYRAEKRNSYDYRAEKQNSYGYGSEKRNSYNNSGEKGSNGDNYNRKDTRGYTAISVIGPTISKQPRTPSPQPNRGEPTISQQPQTRSEPDQNDRDDESMISQQPQTRSEPDQDDRDDESMISQQLEKAFQSDQDEQDGEADYDSEETHSPAIRGTNDQTIKIPVEAIRNSRQPTERAEQ